MTQANHPIQILYDIQQRCVEVAKGLPQRDEVKNVWSGIGFRIGEFQFVAPLKQVNEVLHYPRLTKFPGTQSWVKGIANIRGSLVPIMDLSAYMGKSHIHVNNQSRIMIIRHEDMNFALLVDEVQGLKHFSDEEKISAVTKFDAAFKDYIQGAFQHKNDEYLVFNMHTLSVHPEFYNVAV